MSLLITLDLENTLQETHLQPGDILFLEDEQCRFINLVVDVRTRKQFILEKRIDLSTPARHTEVTVRHLLVLSNTVVPGSEEDASAPGLLWMREEHLLSGLSENWKDGTLLQRSQ